MSIVAMARPAPLTMQPIVPIERDVVEVVFVRPRSPWRLHSPSTEQGETHAPFVGRAAACLRTCPCRVEPAWNLRFHHPDRAAEFLWPPPPPLSALKIAKAAFARELAEPALGHLLWLGRLHECFIALATVRPCMRHDARSPARLSRWPAATSIVSERGHRLDNPCRSVGRHDERSPRPPLAIDDKR